MDRYSRQLLYKNIGKEGQSRLLKAKVCVIGIGALGTVCSELLARAGIGSLYLVDRDFVEQNNLQRQLLFDETDIGKPKAEAASARLSAINSGIEIRYRISDIDHNNISFIGRPDVILVCTDNMESRFLVNDYCRKNSIKWIYGAAVEDRGSIYNVTPERPCLRCIFKGSSDETCDTSGVLNAASAITGSMMANEAIKIILGDEFEKQLIMFNIWGNDFEKIKTKENKDCPACNKNYEYLSGNKQTKTVKLCGQGTYQIKGNVKNIDAVLAKFSKLGKVTRLSGIMHFKDITLFDDGRAIIKADSEAEARKKYSSYFG